MTEDLTRRKVLASLGAAGGLGMAAGAGANALLFDVESFENNPFTSGNFNLVAGWGGETTDLTIDGLVADSSGTEILDLAFPDGESNPGWLWFRPRCPDPQNAFASDLDVSLYYDETDELIVSGDLCEVSTQLRAGTALDGQPGTDTIDCLPEGDSLPLRLEWSYGGTGDGPVTWPIDVRAEQCRHNPTPENPFTETPACDCPQHHGISWIKIYICSSPDATAGSCDCQFLGKLALDDGYAACEPTDGISDNYIAPGTYDLFVDDDCEDTGYDVEIESTATKNDGSETTAVEFELLDPDGDDPVLCKVEIFGGGETVTYGPDSLDGNHTIGKLEAPEL